jgi:hypothetical protein
LALSFRDFGAFMEGLRALGLAEEAAIAIMHLYSTMRETVDPDIVIREYGSVENTETRGENVSVTSGEVADLLMVLATFTHLEFKKQRGAQRHIRLPLGVITKQWSVCMTSVSPEEIFAASTDYIKRFTSNRVKYSQLHPSCITDTPHRPSPRVLFFFPPKPSPFSVCRSVSYATFFRYSSDIISRLDSVLRVEFDATTTQKLQARVQGLLEHFLFGLAFRRLYAKKFAVAFPISSS